MATATLIALLLQASAASAAPTDLDALLAALRQPPPSETAFVERRESALLDAPILLHGRLRHPREGVLAKQVDAPYEESTTIRDGRVEVQREGEARRRFSLRRAPGLEALLASFHGLLQGDRALLERHYQLSLEPRTGALAGAWTLGLTPRDPRLARQVRELRFLGVGRDLRCLLIVEADGDRSAMLLGSAAAQASEAGSEPPFDDACGGDPA